MLEVSILKTEFFLAVLPENQICISSRFLRNTEELQNNLQSFTKSSPRLADQVMFRSQGKIHTSAYLITDKVFS